MRRGESEDDVSFDGVGVIEVSSLSIKAGFGFKGLDREGSYLLAKRISGYKQVR